MLAGCQHFAEMGAACSCDVARAGELAPRVLHVRAQLTRGGTTRRHEAVVEVANGRVTLVALTPIGTRAFVVTDGPEGLAIDDGVSWHLGQSPRLLYDAIARAYLAPPDASAVEESGAAVVIDPNGVTRVTNPRCGYAARLVLVPNEPVPSQAPARGSDR
jgi:hypothetical protein